MNALKKYSNALPPGCIVCGKDHQVFKCNKLKSIGDDERKLRLLQSALNQYKKSSNAERYVKSILNSEEDDEVDEKEDSQQDESNEANQDFP